MSKETAVQPAKEEVKASAVVPKNVPLGASPMDQEGNQQVATAAAAGKVAPKPRAAKKVLAEEPGKKAVVEKSTPTPKPPAKQAKKAAVAAKEKVAAAPKSDKTAKVKKQAPKKPRLVRDSFTIPEIDYALFAALKQRALNAGVEVRKGEVLRAALVTLARLDDAELVKAIGLIERIKTGRPKK